MRLARFLAEAGARLTVSDVDAVRVERAAAELGRRRGGRGRDLRRRRPTSSRPTPAGGILNDDTIPRLRAAAVVGAANDQLAGPAPRRRPARARDPVRAGLPGERGRSAERAVREGRDRRGRASWSASATSGRACRALWQRAREEGVAAPPGGGPHRGGAPGRRPRAEGAMKAAIAGTQHRVRRPRRRARRPVPARLPARPRRCGTRRRAALAGDAPGRALRRPRLRRHAARRRPPDHGAHRRRRGRRCSTTSASRRRSSAGCRWAATRRFALVRRHPERAARRWCSRTRAPPPTRRRRSAAAPRRRTPSAARGRRASRTAFLQKAVGDTTRKRAPRGRGARASEMILAAPARGIVDALAGLAARADSGADAARDQGADAGASAAPRTR